MSNGSAPRRSTAPASLGARFFHALALLAAFTMIAAAQNSGPRRAAPPGAPQAPPPTPDSGATFTLISKAFGDGTRMPDRFTVEGEDLSPPLSWSSAPAGTRSFAIVCEDLDIKPRPWVHWVVYGIPAEVGELPEGIKRERELAEPIVAKQGSNSWSKDNIGYRGPATPRGDQPHRYRFTIYALKAIPETRPGLNAEALRNRMKDLILAEATLTGTFSRARRPGETPPGVQAPELPRPPQAPKAPAPPGSAPPSPPGSGA